MTHPKALATLALALLPLLASAQAVPLFKGPVSEAGLVDALLPERTEATRSFTVRRDKPAVASAPKQAAASMLITFETNSAQLTPQARQVLDTLGRAMQSDKLAEFNFYIEGHADPRGGEQFNLDLSQQRAESVVSYLSDKMQIDRNRLKPVGKGQAELLNKAHPDSAENRRVTVKTIIK